MGSVSMSDRVIGAGCFARVRTLAGSCCMTLYPKTKPGKINWFNSKIAPWNSSATSIGTTSTAVTALQTLVTAAQAALADQVAAEQTVKTKTATADVAVAAMVVAGADIIKNIRAKAANSADPNVVYNLAEIPAPATPSPVSTLGTPTDFVVGLETDGSVTVKWKCTNPRATGTIYQVWRRLESETEFAYLG